MPKLKKLFSSIVDSDTPSDFQLTTQLAFEVGKWKAKYETIKEVMDYERKKRKEVETNLNKVIYELGGVKSEVRLLEEKIRLLTGQPAEKPAEVPELRYQPAESAEVFGEKPEKTQKLKEGVSTEPFAGTTESPRLYIKFASAKSEIATAAPQDETPTQERWEEKTAELEMPEAVSEPSEPQAPAIDETYNIMAAMETNFKEEAVETWSRATTLLDILKNSPQDLYYERVDYRDTRGGVYYDFVDRLRKLHADYGHYKHLQPGIDSDLGNLDKVIPYLNYSLDKLYHEA